MPGSDAQTKCEAGSVAPRKCSTPPCSEGAAKCDLCEAGKYQDESGEEDCKVCEPGHFCEEGAPVPTACKAGTYSNRTDLGSQVRIRVRVRVRVRIKLGLGLGHEQGQGQRQGQGQGQGQA